MAATANPTQLYLLADHIKLSLLERQRAVSLNLSPDSQDGQIARSLESLSSGIEALDAQLAQSPDESLQDQVSRLRSQYTDLSSQFGAGAGAAAAANDTLSSPNNPSLSSDFAAAQQTARPAKKAVHFTDDDGDDDPLAAANRAALFPYRDDPDEDALPDQSDLSNQQIHDYHRQVIRDQDEQLDRLGESIGRQRELSIQIGDELDSHVMLLDEVDEAVDRHQSQLDRAGKRLARVGRKARENWSMTVIVVLIVILVLLIIITK